MSGSSRAQKQAYSEGVMEAQADSGSTWCMLSRSWDQVRPPMVSGAAGSEVAAGGASPAGQWTCQSLAVLLGTRMVCCSADGKPGDW